MLVLPPNFRICIHFNIYIIDYIRVRVRHDETAYIQHMSPPPHIPYNIEHTCMSYYTINYVLVIQEARTYSRGVCVTGLQRYVDYRVCTISSTV